MKNKINGGCRFFDTATAGDTTTDFIIDLLRDSGGVVVQTECDLFIKFGDTELMLTYCVLGEDGKVVRDFDYTAFAGDDHVVGEHDLLLVWAGGRLLEDPVQIMKIRD